MAQLVYVSLANPGAPWQTVSGAILSTAATATLSPEGAGGVGDDPQIFSFYQGQVIRVTARGVYTSSATANNATFALYASASAVALASGTSLATTGALPLTTTALTGSKWKLEAFIQVRAYAQGTGTATVYTDGDVELQTATPTAGVANVTIWPMPSISGPFAASLDTTITHTIGLVGTLSSTNDSITCTQFLLEPLAG